MNKKCKRILIILVLLKMGVTRKVTSGKMLCFSTFLILSMEKKVPGTPNMSLSSPTASSIAGYEWMHQAFDAAPEVAL